MESIQKNTHKWNRQENDVFAAKWYYGLKILHSEYQKIKVDVVTRDEHTHKYFIIEIH